jgi:uncharacterized OB-fold protein
MAKLISFSLVSIVPPPFKTEYVVGIVEDGKGNRMPVRIEKNFFDSLKIGVSGRVEKKVTDFGELTFFIPEIEKHSRDREKDRKESCVDNRCD